MGEGIRKANLFGGYKTIIGDGKSDIVLETLGKVYIKTGNNFKLITEICKQVKSINEKDPVIITLDIESMEYPGDGKLIFDSDLKALYISYKSSYILLLDNDKINYPPNYEQESSDYVKKSGDTMYGQLSITYKGAPLIVASKTLVSNLNCEYINGISSEEIAIKHLNENISGSWIFENDLQVNNILESKKEIIVDNIIGTKQFQNGYNGYGWRLDSNTNMLTIDYLIVRKAMHIYELVLNRISATNGALWVTDTTKIDTVLQVSAIDLNDKIALNNISKDIWYLPINSLNIKSVEITGDHLANANGEGLNKLFYNYGYLICFSEIPTNLNTLSESEILNLDLLKKVLLFETSAKSLNVLITDNAALNPVYDLAHTPYFYSTKNKNIFQIEDVQTIYSYYKYFASTKQSPNTLYVIDLSQELFPTIKEGDIIRCLKFKNNSIKYYDALVVGRIDNSYKFILLLAESVFDLYTNDLGSIKVNTKSYAACDPDPNNWENPSNTEELAIAKINENPNLVLTLVEAKDELVRIGSILNNYRQGSLYFSSSEYDSPNIKVLNNVDRPDYNVIYTTPIFLTINFEGKSYYYILEKENTNKENCHQINGNWYSLFELPTINCEIEKNSLGLKARYNNHIMTQVGKLDGIHDDLFGDHQPKGYGLYGKNVYLTGEFYLNNGKSVANIGDDIELKIKNNYLEAGLYIGTNKEGEPVIVLYSPKVEIKNTKDGDSSVLFLDGKILSKYIDVDLLSFNQLIGKDANKTLVIGINLMSKGETILYYSDGSIMNGKFMIYDENGGVIGCREYFLSPNNKITLEKLSKDNPVYTLETQYSQYIIRILDYFEDKTPLKFTEFKYYDIKSFVNTIDIIKDLENRKLLEYTSTDSTINLSKNNENLNLHIENNLIAYIDNIINDVNNYYSTHTFNLFFTPLCEKNYINLITNIINRTNTTKKGYRCNTVIKNQNPLIYTSLNLEGIDVTKCIYNTDAYASIYDRLGKSGWSNNNKSIFESLILNLQFIMTNSSNNDIPTIKINNLLSKNIDTSTITVIGNLHYINVLQKPSLIPSSNIRQYSNFWSIKIEKGRYKISN